LKFAFFWKFPQPTKFAFSEVSATQFFLQLMKFAFLEVSAIHSISQCFATFCNVIETFATISLIFATLLQPYLSLQLSYIAIIGKMLQVRQFYSSHLLCKSFTMQFITWF